MQRLAGGFPQDLNELVTVHGVIKDFWSGRASASETTHINNVLSHFDSGKAIGKTYRLGKFDKIEFDTFMERNRDSTSSTNPHFPDFVYEIENALPDPVTFDCEAFTMMSEADRDIEAFLDSFWSLRSPEMLLAAWECMHFIPFGSTNFIVADNKRRYDVNREFEDYTAQRKRRYEMLRQKWELYSKRVAQLVARNKLPYRAIVDPCVPIFAGSRFVWLPKSRTAKELDEERLKLDTGNPHLIWHLTHLERHPFHKAAQK